MKHKKTVISAIIALGLTACQSMAVASSDEGAEMAKPSQKLDYGHMAEQAPPQLMHLGKLAGHWYLTEQAPNADGSGWAVQQNAEWTFRWGLGGWSIVDDYVAPSFETVLEDETKRQRGTNLRTYHVADDKWVMTWLTTTSKIPQGFTAISDDETVTMLSDIPYINKSYVRITFFDMTDNTFDWKMELSKDGKEGWSEVYRIHGDKKH